MKLANMDSASWLQESYSLLSQRAGARKNWPQLGFCDPAAQIVLDRLNAGIRYLQPVSTPSDCIALKRSQWMDHRCQQFFARYPHALCVELGAGFSTRFHRLSELADWPRFRWLEVDTADVIQQKAKLLPAIDNYELVAANIVDGDWLAHWQGEPLIIVLEHRLMFMSQAEVQHVFAGIAKHVQGRAPVEIVFDYLSPATLFWAHLKSLCGLASAPAYRSSLRSAQELCDIDPCYSVLRDMDIRPQDTFWQSCSSAIYQRISGGLYLQACASVSIPA